MAKKNDDRNFKDCCGNTGYFIHNNEVMHGTIYQIREVTTLLGNVDSDVPNVLTVDYKFMIDGNEFWLPKEKVFESKEALLASL